MQRFLSDNDGTVSIELAVVLGGLVAVVVAAAIYVAQPLHDYANRLNAAADHASQVLQDLKATPTPAM